MATKLEKEFFPHLGRRIKINNLDQIQVVIMTPRSSIMYGKAHALWVTDEGENINVDGYVSLNDPWMWHFLD